jgi:predicted HTH domain antitoxin
MGFVRAKKDVYLGASGYHRAGSEFNYEGPDHDDLEAIDPGPYAAFSDGELKDELARRRIALPPGYDHKMLSDRLIESDKTEDVVPVEPDVDDPFDEDDSLDEADQKYHGLSRDELKAELANRQITYRSNANDKKLRELLEADDAKATPPEVDGANEDGPK